MKKVTVLMNWVAQSINRSFVSVIVTSVRLLRIRLYYIEDTLFTPNKKLTELILKVSSSIATILEPSGLITASGHYGQPIY